MIRMNPCFHKKYIQTGRNFGSITIKYDGFICNIVIFYYTHDSYPSLGRINHHDQVKHTEKNTWFAQRGISIFSTYYKFSPRRHPFCRSFLSTLKTTRVETFLFEQTRAALSLETYDMTLRLANLRACRAFLSTNRLATQFDYRIAMGNLHCFGKQSGNFYQILHMCSQENRTFPR